MCADCSFFLVRLNQPFKDKKNDLKVYAKSIYKTRKSVYSKENIDIKILEYLMFILFPFILLEQSFLYCAVVLESAIITELFLIIHQKSGVPVITQLSASPLNFY